MILKDLLKDIYSKPITKEEGEIFIQAISCDSRQEQPQALFVAIDGFKFKGEDFIPQAIKQGAVAIAKRGASRNIGQYTIAKKIVVLDVQDPKSFLRQITLRLYDSPSKKVRTIGITGTNGKTTITYLLENIFKFNHQACAVIGTVNYRIAGKVYPSKNTTPGFLENQTYLAHLAQHRIPYCVMEVSSHALEQGRVDGIDFKSAIFTNLTQDHLDYHKDMESYFKAKSILFEGLLRDSSAIINVDDPYGQRLLNNSKSQIVSYGIKNSAYVKAENIKYALNSTQMDIHFPSGQRRVKTRFIGEHNVYNILAASACAYHEGINLDVIARAIEDLQRVPGRLEAIEGTGDYFVFIDYAHTQDGLMNVLQALRKVSKTKIILVFGCGGDRDRGKRPKMGQVACELADYSFVTSDNPRSEQPEAIIEDIRKGFSKNNYEVVLDRKEAIAGALKMAKKGEMVLIAGKGHEDYQILKDRTIPFNEVEIVRQLTTATV